MHVSKDPSTTFRVTQTFTFAIINVILSVAEESFTPTLKKAQINGKFLFLLLTRKNIYSIIITNFINEV